MSYVKETKTMLISMDLWINVCDLEYANDYSPTGMKEVIALSSFIVIKAHGTMDGLIGRYPSEVPGQNYLNYSLNHFRLSSTNVEVNDKPVMLLFVIVNFLLLAFPMIEVLLLPFFVFEVRGAKISGGYCVRFLNLKWIDQA